MQMINRHLNHSKYVPLTVDPCPLCKRPLDDAAEKHHLVPRSRGGKETERIHRICHRKIHATFDEKQLETEYNNVESLLEHKEIRKFVKWVSKKPYDYYDTSVESKPRKARRKR